MKDHIHLFQSLLMEELNEQQKLEIEQLICESPTFKKQYQLIIALKKAVKINVLKDKMKYLEFVERNLVQTQNPCENDRMPIKNLVKKIQKQMNFYFYLFLANVLNYKITVS